MKMLVALLSLAVLAVSIQAATISQQQMENLARELLRAMSASQNSGQKSGTSVAVRGTCSCNGPTCSCCHGQSFPFIGDINLCGEVGYDADNWKVWYRVTVNGDKIVAAELSGRDPPPLCLGYYKIPILRLCLDFRELDFANNAASGCLTITLTLDFGFFTHSIADVDLGCFHLPVGKIKKGGHTSRSLLKYMTSR